MAERVRQLAIVGHDPANLELFIGLEGLVALALLNPDVMGRWKVGGPADHGDPQLVEGRLQRHRYVQHPTRVVL